MDYTTGQGGSGGVCVMDDERQDDDDVMEDGYPAEVYPTADPTPAAMHDEAAEIDFSKLVDPFCSGYKAYVEGKPRRPRECYMKRDTVSAEKRELWYAGYDQAVVDRSEERERDLKAYALLNRARRYN